MIKTWFITGTSSGFGKEWAETALERGDRVVATARRLDAVEDLRARFPETVLTLELDVTDREGVFAAVEQSVARFGGLDVVVNNAGYGQFGMVEELTERELRQQMETNFFGAVWVTQAVLPVFRRQGHGHLLQVSSEGGVRAYPGIGAYHASKWALEGISESLWQELAVVAPGVHVTNVEPGGYSTNWLASGPHADENAAYDAVREQLSRGWVVGDPRATRAAILEIVDTAEPPTRVFLGRPFEEVEEIYEARLQSWRDWQPLALRAFGHPEQNAD